MLISILLHQIHTKWHKSQKFGWERWRGTRLAREPKHCTVLTLHKAGGFASLRGEKASLHTKVLVGEFFTLTGSRRRETRGRLSCNYTCASAQRCNAFLCRGGVGWGGGQVEGASADRDFDSAAGLQDRSDLQQRILGRGEEVGCLPLEKTCSER